jgi:hypothetical protein
MTRSRSVASPGATPASDTWLPTTLTERLLDVLIDAGGVCAAFIVNDFGELLAVRFAPVGAPRSGFAVALEAAAGLRLAAGSGLEPPVVLVNLATGCLFARRFRRSYLCVWTKDAVPPRALDMSSRLVAASLPPDARMEAAAAPTWDEDDQRPTEPWLPTERDWPQPSLEVSLRAPAIPRELIDTEPAHRSESQRSRTPLESGIAEIHRPRQQPAARARGRR